MYYVLQIIEKLKNVAHKSCSIAGSIKGMIQKQVLKSIMIVFS